MLHAGKQSAFPKIQFIKNRLKIENAIMQGLQQCSSGGGRVVSPILSRRRQDRAQGHADQMIERLDQSFPERQSDYKDESHYTDVSDSLSATSSRPHTPDVRRSSMFEEMRRQSAVFFDDSDMYADEDAVTT
jgi:hypothetical protein